MAIVKKRVRQNATLARRAIADFVDANIPRFNSWLGQVADGIPQFDKDGNIQLDARGVPLWLVKPDPATAIKLVADVCEYHLPKLQRSEASVVAKIEHSGEFNPESMSTEELQRFIATKLLDYDQGSVIDVVPERVEPLPAWMQQDGPKP